MLANWKTTLTGVTIIVLGIVLPMVGVHVPGFSMDPGASLITGMGMIFAKDFNISGTAP